MLEEEPAPKHVAVRVLVPQRALRMPPADFGPLDRWTSLPRRYAVKRGIEAWQVDRWGIGYSVEGRLAGRIVVPYRSWGDGKTILGYTARAFFDHPKRYLEPDPSEHPNRDALFGQQHWPEKPSALTLYVTEGALNALAVERAMPGVSVVALAGSELRPVPAFKLMRWKRLVVLSDPDAAGDKLARQVDALARHVEVERIRLPEGHDAADLPEDELRGFLLRGGAHAA